MSYQIKVFNPLLAIMLIFTTNMAVAETCMDEYQAKINEHDAKAESTREGRRDKGSAAILIPVVGLLFVDSSGGHEKESEKLSEARHIIEQAYASPQTKAGTFWFPFAEFRHAVDKKLRKNKNYRDLRDPEKNYAISDALVELDSRGRFCRPAEKLAKPKDLLESVVAYLQDKNFSVAGSDPNPTVATRSQASSPETANNGAPKRAINPLTGTDAR